VESALMPEGQIEGVHENLAVEFPHTQIAPDVG
jgi:hypothetical protein